MEWLDARRPRFPNFPILRRDGLGLVVSAPRSWVSGSLGPDRATDRLADPDWPAAQRFALFRPGASQDSGNPSADRRLLSADRHMYADYSAAPGWGVALECASN